MGISLTLVITTIKENFKTSIVGLLMLLIGLLVYLLFVWENCLRRLKFYQRITKWINGKFIKIYFLTFMIKVKKLF